MKIVHYKKVSLDYLIAYSVVPIHITVNEYYHVEDANARTLDVMDLRKIDIPYMKYFDTKTNNPSTLPQKFDLRNWVLIAAFYGEKIIGGAVLAMDTPGVNMLKGRNDLAVVWDLRVDGNYRGLGIGSKLIEACRLEAKSKKCTEINIECQNTNVRACNFYNKHAKLDSIKFGEYDGEYAQDVQFIWRIDL
jgi:ribosomal protein S18 acetylase RimI-like enzyme